MTHSGDFLLRVNFVILRGCGEVQVAFAVRGPDAHPVDFVLAGSTVQTEKRKESIDQIESIAISKLTELNLFFCFRIRSREKKRDVIIFFFIKKKFECSFSISFV